MVGHHRTSLDVTGPTPLASLHGFPFVKMTGSGNDFVFFDGRHVPIDAVVSPEAIRAICNRRNGIGADGLVVLEVAQPEADVRIHYFNSDGTPADLCGNATLCSTALSADLGLATDSGMTLTTPAGLISSRLTAGLPEIELQPVTEIRPTMPISLGVGERAVGFATAGIPHLVIFCDDADAIDVAGLGPSLRHHAATGPAGANVNWVSPLPGGGWRYRTFERGVEGETQACGTGAVATAVLLASWGIAPRGTVIIRTSSGRDLSVTLTALADGTSGFRPTLRGEGRVVFRGTIEQIRATD
jgi:diaminopimelate epimerase